MEWILIAMVTLTTLLFAVGGTGFKWARRYVLPMVVLVALWLSGAVWWKFVGVGACLCGAMHLGYGDSTPWWLKTLVICSYFASTLWLGFSWTQIICPAILMGLFVVSQKGKLTWKLWELAAGFMIGFTIGGLIT